MEPERLRMLGVGVILGIACGFLAGRAAFRDAGVGTFGSGESRATAVPPPAAPAMAPTMAPKTAQPLSPAQQAEQKALHDRIDALLARMKQDPKDRQARVDLGNITFDNGIFDMAVKYYDEALALGDRDADVLTDLGIAHHGLGHGDKAVECFERAVKVDPRHINSWYNMALVKLDDLHDRAGSAAALDEALKLDPTFAPALELKARLKQTP